MTGPKPKRKPTPADTTRLRREADSAFAMARSTARMMSRSGLPESDPAMRANMRAAGKAMDTMLAKEDTLRMLKNAAPSGTHHSFAQNVDAFDGASLAERPARASVPRGNPTPDAIPRATGTPALAVRADGTAPLGAAVVTKQAGDARAESSTGRGPSAPQHFDGGRV